MFSVLKKLFSKKEVTVKSKTEAKSRLQFVLVQDRVGLCNEDLANFRKELLCVIEKYFIVNEKDFAIDYRREGNSTRLSINSPVVIRRDFKKDFNKAVRNQRRNRNNYKKEDRLGASGFIIKEENSQDASLPTADSLILERRKNQMGSPNFKRRKKAAN